MMESVLVVEEDASFSRVVCAVLKAGGYDVTAVANPLEARAAAIENPPAVAIVSMESRLGDPDTFIHALADESPDTQCILLALPFSLERLVELYDLGTVYNHCWKPLDEIGDLVRHVARAMERRALKRQNAHLLAELRDARDDLRNMSEFMIQVEKLASLGQLCATVTNSATSGLSRLAESGSDDWSMVDVEDVLSDALGLATARLQDGGMRLTRMVGPAPALTFGSRPLLTQAILHIILNAIDAMPDGGVLAVSCGCEENPRKGIGITIRDTGTGIQPDILPRVFDPFFTTGRLGERTGLGLWSARSIVRQHDGEIALETAVGTGTTVRIWLPAVAAVATGQARSAQPVPILRAA
jgi:signal transduction histidine kinase